MNKIVNIFSSIAAKNDLYLIFTEPKGARQIEVVSKMNYSLEIQESSGLVYCPRLFCLHLWPLQRLFGTTIS